MGNSAGRYARTMASAERRAKAVALRCSPTKPSIYDIADELGVDASTVSRYLSTAIALTHDEIKDKAHQLREIDAEEIAKDLETLQYDLGRIDARLEVLDEQRGADGQLSVDPDTANVLSKLIDSKAKLVARCTELRARRAKMFGVDAPDKVETTVREVEATPAEAMRLMQEQFKGDVGPRPESGGSGQDDRGAPQGTSES